MKRFIKIFFSLIIIGILLYLYAYYIGAKQFKVKEYKLYNNDLVVEYNGFKIIQISDIHYGTSITKKELIKIVNDINSLKPDIVVLTGDLVDNSISEEQHKEITSILSKIKVSIKKYAIEGNHDKKYKKWNELINESGFINLNDSYDLIYKNSKTPIFIAGLSTNSNSKKNIEEKSTTIFDYLNTNPNLAYKILLIHEPDYIDKIDHKQFNMIMAGHSHNGQIRIPYIGSIYKIDGARKYYDDYYKLGDTHLYVSGGLGTTILPIRFNNRPSYNFYRLVNE